MSWALQYTSPEAFPDQWKQIQQKMTEAYRKVIEICLEQTTEVPLLLTPSRNGRFSLS